MPLFDFECPVDGFRFEVLFKRMPKQQVNARKCPQCGARSPVIWPKTVMKPDALWAGQMTNGYGYVTSQGQLKAEMKRRNHVTVGDRTDLEGMDRVAEKAAAEKQQKTRRNIRGVMERAFGPSGLGLGGADGAKMIKENSAKSRRN